MDPTRTLRYVPLEDRDLPEAEQHAFFLRALTAREFATFRDRSVAADDEGVRRIQAFAFDIEILRLALTGWEGPGAPKFPDPPTPRDVEGAISFIAPTLRGELGAAAYELSDVTEDDRKN